MFCLKKNSPLPKFTPEGLLHLCQEVAHQLNQRPVCWVTPREGGGGEVLTPNHFNHVRSAPGALWTPPEQLEKQYAALQDYRARMFEAFKVLVKATSFLPGRWYKDYKPLPREGQVVLNSTGSNKVQKQGSLEYGVIKAVSPDYRNLQIQVQRSGIMKIVDASARNTILLYDPKGDDQEIEKKWTRKLNQTVIVQFSYYYYAT